jgi:hypothetical protein
MENYKLHNYIFNLHIFESTNDLYSSRIIKPVRDFYSNSKIDPSEYYIQHETPTFQIHYDHDDDEILIGIK